MTFRSPLALVAVLGAALLPLTAQLMTATAARADGDPTKGKQIFNKCMVCHSIQAGVNKIGPSLHGVVGRKAGTLADYVIGCMVSNGETQDMLRRCSCSIDTISSILPYDKYEKAETVLMMQQSTGNDASIFKSMPLLKKMVDELRLAQIEADFRCF